MRRYHGFTLLEVMVSLFILSLALLGMYAMQVKTLRQSRGMQSFQQASYLAENMVNYLHAHHGESAAYSLSWNRQIQTVLSEAEGKVTGSYPLYQVLVKWGGMQADCIQNKSGISGCVIVKVAI